MLASASQMQVGLYVAGDDTFEGRVFYIADNIKYWVLDVEWCRENGFKWPDDIRTVPSKFLLACGTGRPMVASKAQMESGDTDPMRLRRLVCSAISGTGLEFGAASNPLPFPVDCRLSYADILSHAELLEALYPGQSAELMIVPDYQASLDQMNELPGGWDFIAASHVIEHVRDPVGAIARCAGKLMPGGKLVLFVPDMRETFDRERKPTSLEHLVEDFYEPSRERDKEHFEEFYRLAFPTEAGQLEGVWTKKWEEQFAIHYHVWTAETFKIMVDWLMTELKLYSSAVVHPTFGNEFCCVLTN